MSIFQDISRSLKRKRMRRSLRVRAYAGKRGVSKVHASPLIPILKVLAIVVIVAGIGFAVYQWGIPYAKTLITADEPAPTPTPVPTPTLPPATYAKADMSDLEVEIKIPHWFISNPYYYNGKVIYTSGQEAATAPNAVNNLLIYDLGSQAYTRVETPATLSEFNNFFEPLMNETWIVWLETNGDNKGGGRSTLR